MCAGRSQVHDRSKRLQMLKANIDAARRMSANIIRRSSDGPTAKPLARSRTLIAYPRVPACYERVRRARDTPPVITQVHLCSRKDRTPPS